MHNNLSKLDGSTKKYLSIFEKPCILLKVVKIRTIEIALLVKTNRIYIGNVFTILVEMRLSILLILT